MTADTLAPASLEPRLARMLGYGTWLGCIVITVGIALPIFGTGFGMGLLTFGIGIFIALPVLRVLLMLVHFLRAGERRFAAISGLVLVIIFSGIAAGLWMGA